MPKLSGNIRHSIHLVANRYRKHHKDKLAKQEFLAQRAALGSEAANANWQDYLNAREQTGCSVLEYFIFRFYKKSRAERDTYQTVARRDRFIHQIHDDESCNATVPGNKVLFNMLFEKYLCREWLNPTAATPEEFVAFMKKHGKVMLKPACDGAGHGIRICEYTTDEDALALHSSLVGAAMLVAASQATTRAARDNRAVMPRVNWAARDSKLSALSMELYTMR